MSPEKTAALKHEFPMLYHEDFWFECDDGWFDLLRDLSLKLVPLFMAMTREEQSCFAVDQVKEKFGGLRYYVSGATSEMYDAIDDAEIVASKTCERCGVPGERRPGGWIKTLCDGCHAKRS